MLGSHFPVNILRKSVTVILVFGMLMLAGCGSHMQAVKTDAKTGYFPTSVKIKPEEIYVREKIDIKKYKSLLLILPLEYKDSSNRKESITANFDDFFKQSVINMMYFDSVRDKREMQRYLHAKGLTDTANYKGLQNKIGDFLIAKASIARIGSFDYALSLKIYNPAAGNPVFSVMKMGFNKDGLDEPLFYPVFNAMLEWINDNK